MNKTTVIFHSADLDGLLCEQIARKFLGTENVEYIGWDFGDPSLDVPSEGWIYVMDLPVDRVFAKDCSSSVYKAFLERTIWIDHHKSNIDSHNPTIPGYRIDGVAACRLAWQWFVMVDGNTSFGWKSAPDGIRRAGVLPMIQDYKRREVSEPTVVMLAGEYDIHDKRWMKEDPRVNQLQTGYKTIPMTDGVWRELLEPVNFPEILDSILERGEILLYAREKEYERVITEQGFDVEFKGLKFLACCSHECDIRGQLFEAGIKPHHEALLGFTFTGKDWRVSLYHIDGKEHVDILNIAKSCGGGGHPGACGFKTESLPFLCLGKSNSNPDTSSR